MLTGLWRRVKRLRGVLEIQDGPDCGKELCVRQWPVTIGRGDEADLPIADRWVSRRHCEIFERDGSLVVRDLGSRHGTEVNGERIAEQPLWPGDRIRIGLTTVVARYEVPGAGKV
jgi:pSer/pThr/pTyr-binding forkhead associated (FHA) protein